jgi:ATP/ADP translocase
VSIERTPDQTDSIRLRILRKAVEVRAPEIGALFLGFAYYFLILSSYYIIRPIRDDIGAANGMENLPWMFTGTLLTMLVANALFAGLVARYSRRRFIPIAYRFFIFNLLTFFVLMKFSIGSQVWIGRVFFAWTSVFNLFVLSVFWAFMVDLFTSDQGKRLFGFISVGGSLGAIVGAAITGFLVQKIGILNLLLISAVLLEGSVRLVHWFPSPSAATGQKLYRHSCVPNWRSVRRLADETDEWIGLDPGGNCIGRGAALGSVVISEFVAWQKAVSNVRRRCAGRARVNPIRNTGCRVI